MRHLPSGGLNPRNETFMLRRLLVAALLAFPIASSASAQAEEFFGFTGPELVLGVGLVNINTVNPFNVKFKSDEKSTTLFAEILPDSETGGHIVMIYWKTFKATFLRIEEESPGQPITSTERSGILAVVMTHELYHKCMGLNPPMSCNAPTTSCQHLAIDFATAIDACALAGELCENENAPGATQEEMDEARELRQGVCIALSEIQDKWDGEENSDVATAIANDCICPSSASQGEFCPFTSNSSCPAVKLPPAANGPQSDPGGSSGETGFDCNSGDPFDPEDNIIPECPACDGC